MAPKNHSKNNDEDGVTAESYGSIDVTAEDVWLLKIPPTLAEAFAAAPEGTLLGDLVFTKGGVDADGKKIAPAFSVHVAEEIAERRAPEGSSTTAAAPAANNLPLHYSLASMTKKVPVLHPFVRHPTNGSMKLWGTVSRTANVQVNQDARYRELIKDRLVKTNITTTRYVRPMENTDAITSRTSTTSAAQSMVANKSSFSESVYQLGKRRLEAIEHRSADVAAGRDSNKKPKQFTADQSLRTVVFELFQQQALWAVKDLKAAAVAGGATHAGTRKAEAEIREVLREIGEYHRSGDQKNMWELRKEYRQG
mmetsp:Transcript_16377/g.31136  ORF Transcript_16377/g.31136 Transcript_16377/m.31136 type:complete len:309 (-) Transcript_16377:120-1046(-)|eukprot:scaffold1959_cov162-Amphora_coffeaeformis.AAC.11